MLHKIIVLNLPRARNPHMQGPRKLLFWHSKFLKNTSKWRNTLWILFRPLDWLSINLSIM